jgi:hypothetical protein
MARSIRCAGMMAGRACFLGGIVTHNMLFWRSILLRHIGVLQQHQPANRMTDRVLKVEYRGLPVWTAEPWKWERRQDEPSYIRFHEKVKR